METCCKKPVFIFLLRISLGVVFFYSGLTKVLDPEWTSSGFLAGAQTFSALFGWFTSAGNIVWVDFLNEWGQLFIGLGLLTGLFTRLACVFAILLMVLYYLPYLDFPYVEHGFLIDEHVIYALVAALLFERRAGTYLGLDWWLNRKVKNFWV